MIALIIAAGLLIMAGFVACYYQFSIITYIILIIAFSIVVSAIYINRTKNEKSPEQLFAEQEQLKLMVPTVANAGVLSALCSMLLTGTPKISINTLEVLVFTSAIVITTGALGNYYRNLCEKIYKYEEQQQTKKEAVLKEIAEHLKTLATIKAEPNNEKASDAEVIKTIRYTTRTTMEELKTK